MWGRIRDILHLLFLGYTSTERRCRVLEQDMNTLFEKLNLVLAREAKRQSRQAHATVDTQLAEPGSPPGDRKAQLRRRVYGHLRPGEADRARAIGQLPLQEVTNESGDSGSEATG